MLALAEQLEAAGHVELAQRTCLTDGVVGSYTGRGVPGRGSPGSQLKPLRAATRREALPVRHTYSSGHALRSRGSSKVRSTSGCGAVTSCVRPSTWKRTVAHGRVVT